MKFTVSFKTPDALDDVLVDYSHADHQVMREVGEKFIQYGEYLNVEFDTEKQTATVLPVRGRR